MFDLKTAKRELQSYDKRGARGASRRLLEAVERGLQSAGLSEFSHLDIGGGVGVLQHELASGGATRTTAVDASAPYLELLREAAEQRGYGDRHERIEGDFTDVADRVEPSTVVTLDKVICCYPDMPALVRASAQKATALYAIVVPQDAAWIRRLARVANWFMRVVLRWSFQGFVHPHGAIDACCEEQGLKLATDESFLLWSVRVYARKAA